MTPLASKTLNGSGVNRGKLLNLLLMGFFTAIALVLIYAPVAWLIISSIATRNDLLTVPLRWIPEHANLQNYVDILIPGTDVSSVAATFKVTLRNSIFVAGMTTLICLAAGSLAAYALARLQIPFRRFMLMGIMSTRMIPEVSLVIPLYILASKAGLMDSPTILIFTYLSFALPFAIWMLAAFFEAVPYELEDAARIDGASRLGILFRVILPVSTPGIVSTALFTFLLAWDEFFFALIFTSTLAAKTVPVAIAEFTGRYAVDITGMMTGGVLAALPPVILSLIFQRYIVSGLTAGAVKGWPAMAELLVGIDLGGTNVRVGLVSPAGKLLMGEQAPIEARRGPQVGVAKIAAMIDDLLREAPQGSLLGIGIGSTGPVDRERGAIQNPYTLPTWADVDIARPLEARFGVPVALENDADAAALGEAWVGAGRGMRRLAAVTVGTGIGTAFILDGKIYRGMQALHPEGGHIPIDPAGPACYCGAHGCWESLASGPAIARLAAASAVESGGLMMELASGDPAKIDARVLVRAARRGDPVAAEVIGRVAFYLGLGLVSLITLYLPEGIVLSGGVMAAYDLFAPGIQAAIERHSVMTPTTQVQIMISQLKGQAGVLGAARAALNVVQESSAQ